LPVACCPLPAAQIQEPRRNCCPTSQASFALYYCKKRHKGKQGPHRKSKGYTIHLWPRASALTSKGTFARTLAILPFVLRVIQTFAFHLANAQVRIKSRCATFARTSNPRFAFDYCKHRQQGKQGGEGTKRGLLLTIARKGTRGGKRGGQRGQRKAEGQGCKCWDRRRNVVSYGLIYPCLVRSTQLRCRSLVHLFLYSIFHFYCLNRTALLKIVKLLNLSLV
jgi:hypothetical protein